MPALGTKVSPAFVLSWAQGTLSQLENLVPPPYGDTAPPTCQGACGECLRPHCSELPVCGLGSLSPPSGHSFHLNQRAPNSIDSLQPLLCSQTIQLFLSPLWGKEILALHTQNPCSGREKGENISHRPIRSRIKALVDYLMALALLELCEAGNNFLPDGLCISEFCEHSLWLFLLSAWLSFLSPLLCPSLNQCFSFLF